MIELCVELVTINGLPFRVLECSALKKLFDPITKSLGITINRKNIRDQIIRKAEKYRDLIKSDIKSKMLSIKVDSASRLDRSVLGVNIQYEKDNEIIIRTLAVKELKESHTGEYICKVIIEILRKYDINIKQIYTFTSDNGRNMLKPSVLLKTHQDCQLENIVDIDDKACNYDDDIDDDDQYFEPYDEKELESIILTKESPVLTSVKCMAHTLQLAVNDAIIKNSTFKTCIEKALSVVIKLRTPTVLEILKCRKLRKPIRNITTRWNSTFLMVKRLLEFRSFCEELETALPDLYLSANDWKKLEDFCLVLKCPFDTTISLQTHQLILSEAFAVWYRMKLELLEINNNSYAKALLIAVDSREKNLITQCSPILTAVFLDPRYKSLLTDDQIKLAKNHLTDLFNYVNANNFGLSMNTSLRQNNTQSTSESTIDDPNDILNRFLADKMITAENSPSCIPYLIGVIESAEKVMPKKDFNPFQYWKQKNISVATVANIVLAVPATQVSVERVFSILKWILTDRRNNLDPSILEDTLLLILNQIVEQQ